MKKCQVPWTTTKATDLSPVSTSKTHGRIALCCDCRRSSELLGLSLWRLGRSQLYHYWSKQCPQEALLYSPRLLNAYKKQLKVSRTLHLNLWILSRIVVPWWKLLSQKALQKYSINTTVLEYPKIHTFSFWSHSTL